MIRRIPPAWAYTLLLFGLVLASFPVWSLWLFGFSPSLDQLLSLRCLVL
jgi:hypothetical protein